MEMQKVDVFMISNAKYFPQDSLPMLRERLIALPDERFVPLLSVDYRDPITMLIISIFVGNFGVDRFMLDEVGMGVLKLLTGGLCGILTIIDWFTVMKRTKEYNLRKLLMYI